MYTCPLGERCPPHLPAQDWAKSEMPMAKKGTPFSFFLDLWVLRHLQLETVLGI